MGGSLNAYTGREQTCYYAKVGATGGEGWEGGSYCGGPHAGEGGRQLCAQAPAVWGRPEGLLQPVLACYAFSSIGIPLTPPPHTHR
jgi:hypothetical protein